MPRGSHRASGRRRWPLVVAAIVILGAGGAAAWLLLGGNPLVPTPEFEFEFGKIGGAPVAERAPEAELRDAAEEVREALEELYTIGFVDPARWEGGRFPDLLDAFTPEARQRARKDLANLSLGTDATKIDSVDPIAGRLSLKFLVDEGGGLIAATARTIFSANALATDGGNVAVQHDGTYYLQPGEDGWLIHAYDVEGIVTRVTQPLPDPDASPT